MDSADIKNFKFELLINQLTHSLLNYLSTYEHAVVPSKKSQSGAGGPEVKICWCTYSVLTALLRFDWLIAGALWCTAPDFGAFGAHHGVVQGDSSLWSYIV